MQFYVAFCGVPFCVSSVYDSTKSYCREYLVGETKEALPIVLTEAAIERERDNPRASKPYLETLALLRSVSEALAKQSILLFHGSAIVLDGKAYLFTAPSGTGKSTHAAFWKKRFGDRVSYINDDKPFLKREADGTFCVYSNPWRGKEGRGSVLSAPLCGIAKICRSEDNRVERMPKEAVLPLLLSQTYLPENEISKAKVVSLLMALGKNVPMWHLYCNLKEETADVAYRALCLGENDET